MSPEKTYSVDEILAHVTPTPVLKNGLTRQQKMEQISVKVGEIMDILGLDRGNDSLRETPQRVAKMYVDELFSGLWADSFPKITVIDNDMGYDQMVVAQRVEIKSTCEHHFQTIDGFASIAYIPKNRVVGLSKINRVARYFSRRPQVQERLTKQIADCLCYVLDTENVAVHISAKHYCMAQRGVEDTTSTTVTCDLRGDFKVIAATRAEFLSHCDTDYFR